jgi:16S rRNA U516 pseudouridylate synthase RsuA-like enzyme
MACAIWCSSRRGASRLLTEGRVPLNNQAVTCPATLLASSDLATLDGKPVGRLQPLRRWRYHEPEGLLPAQHDPHGCPTMFKSYRRTDLPPVVCAGRLGRCS